MKCLVNAPTTAGLRDPSSLQDNCWQLNSRQSRRGTTLGLRHLCCSCYWFNLHKTAEGFQKAKETNDAPTLPIGAKRPSSTPAPKASTLLLLPLEHLRAQVQRQRLQQGMSLLELVQLPNKAPPPNRMMVSLQRQHWNSWLMHHLNILLQTIRQPRVQNRQGIPSPDRVPRLPEIPGAHVISVQLRILSLSYLNPNQRLRHQMLVTET